MADVVDIANDNLATELDASIARIRRAAPEAEFTGECLSCYQPVEYPRRWCDQDCCARWEDLKRKGLL